MTEFCFLIGTIISNCLKSENTHAAKMKPTPTAVITCQRRFLTAEWKRLGFAEGGDDSGIGWGFRCIGSAIIRQSASLSAAQDRAAQSTPKTIRPIFPVVMIYHFRTPPPCSDPSDLRSRQVPARPIENKPQTMNRETFKPKFFIHIVAIGLSVFFAYSAYRSSVDHFVNGGMPLRILLVSVCSLLSILVAWLYVRSGSLSYIVTDAGLELDRLFQRTVVPWESISEIRWNRPLHYVTLHSEDGVIGFPNLGDLLHRIHQQSNCRIPDHLRTAMYGNS